METRNCAVVFEFHGRVDSVLVQFKPSTLVLEFHADLEKILKRRALPFSEVKLYTPGQDMIDALNTAGTLLKPSQSTSTKLVPILSEIALWVTPPPSVCLYAELLCAAPPLLAIFTHPAISLNTQSSSMFTAQDLVDNKIFFEAVERAPSEVQAIKTQAEALRLVTQEAYSEIEAVWPNVQTAFRVDDKADPQSSQKLADHFVQLKKKDPQSVYQLYSSHTAGAREGVVFWLFLGDVSVYVGSTEASFFCFWNKSWPHGLPIIVTTQKHPDSRLKLDSRSNFCLWKGPIPYFLGEVYSEGVNNWEKLLIQGAYLVQAYGRLNQHGFVLPLIYINELFTAKVVYMWSNGADECKYSTRSYYLNTVDGAPQFLAVLYNLCDRKIDFDPQLAVNFILTVKNIKTEGSLNWNRGDSSHSRGNKGDDKGIKRGVEDKQNAPKKRPNTGGPQDNVEVGLGGTNTAEFPSTTRLGKSVFRKGNVISKRVRGLELELLNTFLATKPDNIIHPLYISDDAFGTSAYFQPLIVLADAHYNLFMEELDPNFLRYIIPMTWDLASGVTYLHSISVAHRDINPNNLLLVPGSFTLIITDFDLAVQNKTKVYDTVGTEGYMAPEVVDEGPYNPFQADLFSCGKVFEYLWRTTIFFPEIIVSSSGLEELKDFAKRLQDMNLCARPSISEWLPEEPRVQPVDQLQHGQRA